MNADLQALQELGEGLDPPTGQPPPDLRRRVLTGALANRDRRRLFRSIGRFRLAWQLGAPAAAGVAVAVVVLVIQTMHAAGTVPPPEPSGTGVAAAPSAQTRPDQDPDVARILQLAARRTTTRPWTKPRPEQFVFTETVQIKLTDLKRHHLSWQSVDGSREGITLSKPVDPRAAKKEPPERYHTVPCTERTAPAPNPKPNRTDPCVAEPPLGHFLPTDVLAMQELLYRRGDDEAVRDRALPADRKALQRFGLIVSRQSLPPDVHAAAFQAAARIPGLAVIRNAKDVTGRRGVALARTDGGIRAEVIFDPKTYEYLGSNTVVVDKNQTLFKSSGAMKRGDLIDGSALLRTGIVDGVEKMP